MYKGSILPVSDDDVVGTDFDLRPEVEPFWVVNGVGGDVVPRVVVAVRAFVWHHQIRQERRIRSSSVGGGVQSLTEVLRVHDIRNAQLVHNRWIGLGARQFVIKRGRTDGVRVVRRVKAVLLFVVANRHDEQGQ